MNILIVENSKTMRYKLAQIISEIPNANLMATVKTGSDFLDFLESNSPDIIILDIYLQDVNVISLIKKIMRKKKPIPIIITYFLENNCNLDFNQIINLGVIASIPKPLGKESLFIENNEDLLKNKIYLAYEMKNKLKPINLKNQKKFPKTFSNGKNQKKESKLNTSQIKSDYLFNEEYHQFEKKLNASNLDEAYLTKSSKKHTNNLDNLKKKRIIPPKKILFIGSSTGGPPEVTNIVKSIKFNPKFSIIVIQHMPEGFTKGFSQRLDQVSKYHFSEISNHMAICAGKGYCAKGGYHLLIKMHKGNMIFLLNEEARIHGIRPSIDYTLKSLAPLAKSKLIVFILTGMGKDGSSYLHLVKQYGGKIIVQNPDEALIDSMPRNAIKTGLVDNILRTSEIPSYINQIS